MTELSFSNHAVVRMSQRNILPNDLDLILAIGSEVEDGYLVRTKDVQGIEKSLRALLKRLKKIQGKRLVVADGCIITAFHAADREQRRLLRNPH